MCLWSVLFRGLARGPVLCGTCGGPGPGQGQGRPDGPVCRAELGEGLSRLLLVSETSVGSSWEMFPWIWDSGLLVVFSHFEE